MHTYDVHIKNGEVIDGTGAPKFKSDIVIDNGKIIGVFPPENGDVRDPSENHFLSNFKAKYTLDAENKIISPGFIDVHTHDDDNVFLDPTMSSKISQGVTTCIAGNCGISLAPFSYKGDVPAPIALLGKSDVFRFPRVKDYRTEFEDKPSTVNVALLTGHSMLRVEAMNGEFERPASKHEINKMVDCLKTALEDGSIGLSTGLAYPAANDAPTSEIIELAKILPEFDGVFTTHMRNEAIDVIKSVNETIKISSSTKVRTVISHHKCAGRENWGKSKTTLKLIEEASKLNLTLGLEPIGSWEILKKGHFNSIANCLKLVKNYNHRVIIDLYHSFADVDLDTFLKKSPKLGLLQFCNINFDKNYRPVGRKTINNLNNQNNLNLSKYIKYICNRKDNIKIEFEVFQSDINDDPKDVILNLKNEVLNLL